MTVLFAAVCFLLEATPFLCSYVFLGKHLRLICGGGRYSGAVGKLSSAAGLDTVVGSGKGGGVGGMLKKVIRK